MKTIHPLFQLHRDIDGRVESIRQEQPDWLCGKGCDGCCRSLADVPQLTAAEWTFLRKGLDALSAERLADIRRVFAVLRHADVPTRPVVCPLLDQRSGACPVYAQRPVACRTYGFYIERDKGLYCRAIESGVAAGGLANVVWGNHEVIDRQLAGMGEKRPLTAWFDDWDGVAPPVLPSKAGHPDGVR